MRLLSVIHGPVFGGAHNQLVQLRDPLMRRGIETIAALSDEPGNAAERLEESGVPTVRLPLHRLRSTANPVPYAAFAMSVGPEVRRLRRLIRERDIDIVQAHSDINAQAAIAGHREGKAVVWQLLDTRTPPALRRITMPLVTRVADAVTTWGDELARVHPGALSLGDRQITVFPPVDSSEFRPDEDRRAAARRELGVGEGSFVVGAVGNRIPAKGHEWLIRAIAEARQGNPNIEARILGAAAPDHAAYDQSLRDEISRLGLDGVVELTDPGSRVSELLPGLDLLVVSSPPRSEGIPTVIGEAMACGLPVVSTDVGAVREIVEEGATGFVVPAEQAGPLATRIGELAADPGMGKALGETGRRRVLERYDLERCADRHFQAYEIALAHRASR